MLTTLIRFAVDAQTALSHLSTIEAGVAVVTFLFGSAVIVAVRVLHVEPTSAPLNEVPNGRVYKKAA